MSRPARPKAGRIRVGISGWTYTPWRGVFYPKGWPQKRELEYAARQLGGTIEVNGTFYRMQKASSFLEWYAQAPDDFVFAIKGGRFITHIRRLRIERPTLANFFASGPLALREKLGPILWQLPPTLQYDEAVVARFLEMLPRDFASAAALGAEHEPRVTGAYLAVDSNRPIRHAMEVRHASFATASFVELLRRHGVALVVAETADKWPLSEDVTADFVYVRLHGAEQLYVSGYTDAQLDAWTERIRTWAAGGEPTDARRIVDKAAKRKPRDVYVYFDNTDVKLRAPFDAMALMARLDVRGDGNHLPPPPGEGKTRPDVGQPTPKGNRPIKKRRRRET